jgi:hypothetical protein
VLDVTMFRSSPRLAPALSLLRALPGPLSAGLLAALAVGDGIARGRYARSRRWARAQGAGGLASHRLAMRLLTTHGRFVAEEALLGMQDVSEVGVPATVVGLEHMAGCTSGALLIGFHLGPPHAWLMLRARGLHVRKVSLLNAARADPRWSGLVSSGEVVVFPEDDRAARIQALYRIRTLLNANACIHLTADGYGREAFTLDLPGAPLTVRAGWFSLRRQTRVPTFPVLAHSEGRRRVVVIHPALPPVADDEAADREACRAALTPVVADYVRRFPEQCRYLVFPPWDRRAAL